MSDTDINEVTQEEEKRERSESDSEEYEDSDDDENVKPLTGVEDTVQNNTRGYTPTHYNGRLPAAQGEVAKTLDKTSLANQRADTKDLYNFLKLDNPDFRQLNGENRCFTAMISIPNTHKVRIIYGFGYGTSGIGSVSPIADHILSLYGEGGAIGCPQMMMINDDFLKEIEVLNPTEEQIQKAFDEGHQLNKETHKAREIKQSRKLLRLAPIPPYFVFDGFEQDLDAAEVYERLHVSTHDTAEWKKHAESFLRSCLVGSWRVTDKTRPSMDNHQIQRLIPTAGRKWATTQFQALFPTLNRRQVLQATPALPPLTVGRTAPAPPTVPAPTNMIQLDMAMLQELLKGYKQIPRESQVEEKKGEETTGVERISMMERNKMKIMCGLKKEDPDSAFPRWFKDLFEKNQDDKDKMGVLSQAIESSFYYDEAEVLLYPTLLKMILKRDWTSGDIGKRAALVNATKGLSPFAMVDMTEEDVAIMMESHVDMENATTLTAADFKAARSKLKPRVPDTAEEFLTMLRRFANLLYALFSSQCPLYKELIEIVSGLKTLSPNARAKLTKHNKAAVLWIILLQSRRFSQGKMEGEEAILWEFKNLQNVIKAKACQSLTHMEIPTELLLSKEAPKRKANELTHDSTHDQRQNDFEQRQGKVNIKLEHGINKALKEAGYPYINKVCEHCGLDKQALLPQLEEGVCQQYLMSGRCKFGKRCKFTQTGNG